MFSHPKILFLVSLLFVVLLNSKFNPYLLFKFLIFIILVKETEKQQDLFDCQKQPGMHWSVYVLLCVP